MASDPERLDQAPPHPLISRSYADRAARLAFMRDLFDGYPWPSGATAVQSAGFVTMRSGILPMPMALSETLIAPYDRVESSHRLRAA